DPECQNRLKYTRRRRISGRNPSTKTCAIIVPSHRRPALICSPVRADDGTQGRQESAALGSGALACPSRQNPAPRADADASDDPDATVLVWRLAREVLGSQCCFVPRGSSRNVGTNTWQRL